MVRNAPLGLALMVSLLLACGGDDDGDGGGDGPAQPDAGGGTVNQLGTTCSDDDPCLTDPPHQCVFLSVGNPDLGYCSPVCATNADCTDGYTGPSTGELTCFVPGQEDACTITCDTAADCPGELACVATGGPVSVCATE